MSIPNVLTVARILLAIPLVILILRQEFGWALFLAAVAGFSDFLDGFLARAFNWKSSLGVVLDPAADKILVSLSYFALLLLAAVPLWLFGVILLRDLLVSGFFVYMLICRRLHKPMAPRNLGKIAVAAQIVLGVVIVMNLHYQMEIPLLPLYLVCAAVTLLSLVEYTVVGFRIIHGQTDEKK